ncbi:MAG: glycolate oxidase subunit GlcD [Candidatus Bathyarchaeota archaeon BA1]|nr:MAG: glycolate oxidase subunit GlcD [Candidatus Bathyarchaeota archaeon BA1]
MPDVVVRPCTTEEVRGIVKLANEEEIPITPRGAGTNLTGGAIPVKGGIVMDMSRMNKILEINRVNRIAIVEPGVLHADLENELAKYGLFWPPDPASTSACTMGGVIAESAGGLRGAKYGTTREWVLGLEVVLPTGEVIKTGAMTHKSVTGYDLTRLIVGSEGTLGVVTKAVLRVCPIPEAIIRISAAFHEIETAGLAVGKVFEAGIAPTIMEIIDRDLIRSVNKWLKLGLPEVDAIMILDVEGTREGAEKLAGKAEKVLKEVGATEVKRATTAKEMEDLYLTRKAAYPSLFQVRGKTAIPDDCCVPVDKLPEAFKLVREASRKWVVPVGILAHAGDGNIHPIWTADARNPEEVDRALKCYFEICRGVLKLSGSVSAEHGIGIVKASLVEEEYGRKVVEIMRAIKKIFDPNNIMNPGKLGL